MDGPAQPVLRTIRSRLAPSVAAAAAALVLLFGTRFAAPRPFLQIQRAGFDTLQRAAPRLDADALAPGTGVVVVDIDEASLVRDGQWPWPRSTVAALIGRLQEAGAAAIGLDLVFPEADRSSPATLAGQWRRDHGLVVAAADGSALPDYDRELAAAMARGRVVAGYALVPTSNGRAPAVANGVTVVGDGAPPDLHDFGGAIPNLPAIDAAAAGQGTFSLPSGGEGTRESDEVVRKLPLFSSFRHTIVPSLAAEVLRVAQGEDAELALRAERGGGWIGGTTSYTARIGDRLVPVETDGEQWLRFGARAVSRTLSASDVLHDAGAAAWRGAVRGRIVLVGTSAIGLADLRPTPLRAFEPGVAIHAAAVEQIAAGSVLTRPSWAPGVEADAAALFGLAVGLAVAWRGARWGSATLAAGGSTALAVAALSFTRSDLLLDVTPVLMSGGACYVAGLAGRHLATERGAGALHRAFGQYLSPQLVDVLSRDPGRLRLGGEERELTFLFTDLEGFTAFTERVRPDLLVSTLNRYLDGVCAVALDHGATIDKIVGDAVHLMFNAPVDQPDHPARAVRCALAIDAFAQGFVRDAGGGLGTTRIGVNTGRAVVGNFGGQRRFDYTAHGDAINTAARLEAANKRLRTRICVSRATVDALGEGSEFRFRPIGRLSLKGKALPVDVFAPAEAGAAESRWADRYGDAFAQLSRGDAEGPAAVLSLLALYPDDPLLKFHAGRIAEGVRGTEVPLQAA